MAKVEIQLYKEGGEEKKKDKMQLEYNILFEKNWTKDSNRLILI